MYDHNNRNQKTGVTLAFNMMADKEEKELPVEFFFYTNAIEKAKVLANEMVKLQYEIYDCKQCSYDASRFSITGCTPKMKITDEAMTTWVEKMCGLGYQYDCEFDGWGTLYTGKLSIKEYGGRHGSQWEYYLQSWKNW